MGCRKYTNIDTNFVLAAYPVNGLFLQKAEKIYLQIERQIADFIKKQGAAIAASMRPIFLSVAPSECAFSCPNSSD